LSGEAKQVFEQKKIKDLIKSNEKKGNFQGGVHK
jgi:hypothetical protein